MNRTEYIRSRFEKILTENINEKADEILTKLNLDKEVPFSKPGGPTDYVQEDDVCEQCGSEMTEGECMECGSKGQGEVMELGGMDSEHPKFGKMNLSKLSKKEIEDLLSDVDNDDDDEWEEIDLDMETDWDQLEEEIEEELHGKQHKIDKNKNGRIDKEDFKMLRKKHMEENNEGEDEEPLYEVEFDLDLNEYSMGDDDIESVKPYGDFSTDSPEKIGRVKNVGDKYQRKISKKFDDYELEEGETEEGNAFTGALAKAKKEGDDEFEVDGKKYEVSEKSKFKNKVTESLIFTENELISLIEKMISEEKDSFKMKEPKGYKEYDKAHKADKKENEDYLKSVAKKMTDYLKGASDSGSKYEMKETEKFPTENGGMKKGNRKKYTPSDAVDDYVDAFAYPGQTNLVYDEIKPNDEWIKANLVGSSKTGNAQVDKDGKALGNVVPSEVGEKFFKNYKENLYGQEQQDASYKRQPQPVDQAGEQTERGSLKSKRGKKTSQSVLNKVEESVDNKQTQKLNEEFSRMQQLMGYKQKTQ
jgi:hypothetical protein